MARIYLFLLLFISPLFSFCQSFGQVMEKSQEMHIPFTVVQYLQKNTEWQLKIGAITARENGNLLLATNKGIVEYDGNSFIPFATAEQIKKNTYSKLFWDDKTQQLFGQVYQGSFHQLYPQYVVFERIKAVDFKNDSLYGIDPDGIIYASSLTKIQFSKKYTTGIKNATCLFKGSKIYFVGSQTRLNFFNPVTEKNSFKGVEDYLKKFAENPFTGELYLIGRYNIYKVLNQDSKLFFTIREVTPEPEIFQIDLNFVSKNEYYITTTDGLVYFLNNRRTAYYKKEILPTELINAAVYDRHENCLFLGTYDNGLLKLQFKNCVSISSENGIKSPGILSSVVTTQNHGVLFMDNKSNVYQYEHDTILPYLNINSAGASLAEIDGFLCLGTWNEGLYLIKNKDTLHHLTKNVSLPDDNVHACFKDSHGKIWVGTSNGIARGESFDQLRPFLTNTIKGRVICFKELDNGTVCIGGSMGVYFVDAQGKILRHWGARDGLQCTEVRSFYEDREKKLWVGTYKGGLYCLDKNQLHHINKMANCLLDVDVFTLAPDGLGYLYLSSNQGLWRVKEKDLSDFYHHRKKFLIPFYYGQEEGILSTEFNGGFQNNYAVTKDHKLVFPTQKGLVIVTPEQPYFKKTSPVVYGITANDTAYKKVPLEFNPGTFLLKFDFTSDLRSNKYNIYYQHKLESGSKMVLDWSPLQREKTIDFELLPSGNYTLSIRALDAFNDNEPQVIPFKFSVLPYYYETATFRIGLLMLIVLVAILLVRLRLNAQKRRIQKKEYYRLQTLELELKAIQAKLNPHFVFNCINCIKYFVLNNDYHNANVGLVKLSKLIRNSVESSDKLFVPLENEINTIMNYIELEKLRLRDKFVYTVHVDEEAECALQIPHMIIQPYIENAIKHGISNLIDKIGVLEVNIRQNGEFLLCTIKDNGIGRKQADLINEKWGLHISKGISLTKEKLDLLNAFYHYNCSIKITDLYNGDVSEGTLIEIEMPVIHAPTRKSK